MDTPRMISHLSCKIFLNGIDWLICLINVPSSRDQLQIIVTDGFEKFYRYNFTIDQLKFKLIKGGDDEAKLLSTLRTCFLKQQIRLTITATKCHLSFTCSTIKVENADLELFALSTTEARTEIRKLLYDFAEKYAELKNESQFQSISGEKSSPTKSARLRGKNLANNPPMKTRKKATGLQYD